MERSDPVTGAPVGTAASSSGGPGLALLGAVLLTGAALWAAVSGGPWAATYRDDLVVPPVDVASAAPAETQPPAPGLGEPFHISFWPIVVVLGIIGTVLLVHWLARLAWPRLALALFRRERVLTATGETGPVIDGGVVPAVEPDVAKLREGVTAAWAHLVENRSPSDAVTAAWIAVEQAAETSGVHRDRAATPTEFTVTVLDATDVDPAAIRTLLSLYHRARFSSHSMTPDDVATAGRCLDALSDGLGA